MNISQPEIDLLIELLRDARTFNGGQKHNATKAFTANIRNEELLKIYREDVMRAQERIDWANMFLTKFETQ